MIKHLPSSATKFPKLISNLFGPLIFKGHVAEDPLSS